MPLVVLQPCSGAASMQHFHDTIDAPGAIDSIADVITGAEERALRLAYPDGRVPLWGGKPGEHGQHVTKWAPIRKGNRVLFAHAGRVFAEATVTYSFRNADAARRDINDVSIDYSGLNVAAGRSPSAVVQEFNVVSTAGWTYAARPTSSSPGATAWRMTCVWASGVTVDASRHCRAGSSSSDGT